MGINDKRESHDSNALKATGKMFSTTHKEEVKEEVKAVEVKEEINEVVEQAIEPKKKGRPFTNREVKKKFSVTLLPSLYNAASSKAYADGHSISEVIGDFLSEYVKRN